MDKLIKISDDHYLIVDDSEIKEGDWIFDSMFGHILQSYAGVVEYNKRLKENKPTTVRYKITHSTQPLGFLQEEGITTANLKPDWTNVKPLSLSEVEEAINGYSVEKLAEKYVNERFNVNPDTVFTFERLHREIFEQGFKAHQELTKDKLFTLNKVIKILEEEKFGQGSINRDEYKSRVISKLQSLLSKTEWDVEFDEDGKLKLI